MSAGRARDPTHARDCSAAVRPGHSMSRSQTTAPRQRPQCGDWRWRTCSSVTRLPVAVDMGSPRRLSTQAPCRPSFVSVGSGVELQSERLDVVGRCSDPTDRGGAAAVPPVLVMAGNPDAGEQSRTEAREARSALSAHGPVDDPVRSARQQIQREALRRDVALRVVERAVLARVRADVVKGRRWCRRRIPASPSWRPSRRFRPAPARDGTRPRRARCPG